MERKRWVFSRIGVDSPMWRSLIIIERPIHSFIQSFIQSFIRALKSRKWNAFYKIKLIITEQLKLNKTFSHIVIISLFINHEPSVCDQDVISYLRSILEYELLHNEAPTLTHKISITMH